MDVRFIKISVLVSLVLSLMTCVSSGFSGYSYAKFRGPVSGPEREVSVDQDDGKYHYHHHHHKPAHDYVAKPDYHFAYGVEDPKSMVKQSRHETRYGDAVKGEYSVLDPDGKYRTVKYTADKHNGFQAEIITDGNHHNVAHYPMPPVEYTPQSHSHEVHHHEKHHPHDEHHHEEHHPHDEHHHEEHHPHEVHHHEEHHPHEVHHRYAPKAHSHNVHHHEEDANSYNEEESSEGGSAYEESEDSSDNENSSEDGDDDDEY